MMTTMSSWAEEQAAELYSGTSRTWVSTFVIFIFRPTSSVMVAYTRAAERTRERSTVDSTANLSYLRAEPILLLRADTETHFPSHGLLLTLKADHERIAGLQMLLCYFITSPGNHADMFALKTIGKVEPERVRIAGHRLR